MDQIDINMKNIGGSVIETWERRRQRERESVREREGRWGRIKWGRGGGQ